MFQRIRIRFSKRNYVAELIWQYLDGVIPADRFVFLEKTLSRWPWARQQFVDCAVLNALLLAYYNPGRYKTLPGLSEMLSPQPRHARDDFDDYEPRPRRKRPAV
ncbi:MAG: hypothetical protein ACIAXF_17070 [Phycisphaerales bacterium JB063]